MKTYLVGGMVRDRLLGLPSKDADFAVEAGSYEEMRDRLVADGFTIYQERPEFASIRARFPDNSPEIQRFSVKDCDLTLCRKEGFYGDGRRPDSVSVGTLMDDLSRRDFTMNAIAETADGEIIDPFHGAADINARIVRCVGDPEDRMREDYLRAVRAARFSVTKGFSIDPRLRSVITASDVVEGMSQIPHERRREELERMFRFGTMRTLHVLQSLGTPFMEAALSDLWLLPTTRS